MRDVRDVRDATLVAQVEALRGVLDASHDLVVVADAGGAIVDLNAAARERWGAVTGQPAVSLFRDRSCDQLAVGRFEWGERGPGGVRAWFGCSVSALAEGGFLLVSSDVTELKRSAERLRQSEQLMVDTQGVAHLGTWEWDITQPTAIWSAELYRIYGLTPETYTPSYEAYLTMVHPDDRDRVVAATNRVFHEHVPYSHDERIFRPDGSMRYLHTWAHPVLDDQGTLLRLLGVCQDITEQKLAEDKVLQLNLELEARVADRTRTIETSMRDLEAFNSMVSHDLRAPLSVIQVTTDLLTLQSSGLPAGASEKVERIKRSVRHMSALVDDLLTLARVGQTPLVHAAIDLSAMSGEILTELQRASPARTADLVVASGLTVTADAGLLHAAMTNLLANSWKYSSRVERARIEVGSNAGERGPVVFVRDNGVGFDMKDTHRLFAPFERLHSTADFPGTGVGLATVHRIVERHGGRIWAESEPGQGATFFIELPRADYLVAHSFAFAADSAFFALRKWGLLEDPQTLHAMRHDSAVPARFSTARAALRAQGSALGEQHPRVSALHSSDQSVRVIGGCGDGVSNTLGGAEPHAARVEKSCALLADENSAMVATCRSTPTTTG